MLAIFPEIAACAASNDVERLAVTIRRYFGGPRSGQPRPSLPEIVANAGLRLRRMPMPTYGALLGKDEAGSFQVVLVLRDKLEPVAERFLLAHLLGHFLYDVQPLIARGEFHVSGFQEIICPLARYSGLTAPFQGSRAEAQREARADQFAAALLLPPGMLRRAAEKLGEPAKLAAFFGVSPACLLRRQQELQMLPSEPVNFLDAEGQLEPTAAACDDNADRPANIVPPDAATGSMPRSFAASTYGATERSTRQRSTAALTVPTKATARNAAARASGDAANAADSQGAAGARGAPSSTAPAGTTRVAATPPGSVPPRPAAPTARSSQAGVAPGLNAAKPALERGPETTVQRSQTPPSERGLQRSSESGQEAGRQSTRESGMERLRQLARKLDKGMPPIGS